MSYRTYSQPIAFLMKLEGKAEEIVTGSSVKEIAETFFSKYQVTDTDEQRQVLLNMEYKGKADSYVP